MRFNSLDTTNVSTILKTNQDKEARSVFRQPRIHTRHEQANAILINQNRDEMANFQNE